MLVFMHCSTNNSNFSLNYHQTQRNNYTQRLIYWKLKRTLAKPKNLAMEQYRAHLRRGFCAPCQTSIVDAREPE